MNAIRGRAEARWLPSRHRFALFRLYAFLRLRGAKPEPRQGLILIVDRDQTAFEHHGMSLWIAVMATCYIAASLFHAWPVPAALAASVPVAVVAIEMPLYASGLLLRRGSNANGIATLLALGAASAHFARQASWIRFVAWQFFALLALNALAAAIVFLLRGSIARLERGVTSER